MTIIAAILFDLVGRQINSYFDLQQFPIISRFFIKRGIANFFKNIVANKNLEIDVLHNLVLEQGLLGDIKIEELVSSYIMKDKYICCVVCDKKIPAFEISYFIRSVVFASELDFSDKIKSFCLTDQSINRLKISKLSQQIDDTKNIMHAALSDILDRGERIDEILVRSSDLAEGSKTFKKDAAKLASCCVLL